MQGRLPRFLDSPARLLPAAFIAAIAVGTALLMLPAATVRPGGTDPLTALFTATSAVCVTGLTVVDTGSHWSLLGQLVIMLLILVGGLGITALATLIMLSVAGRLGLRSRLAAAREIKTSELHNVRPVLVRVAATLLGLQAIAAVLLTLRLLLAYDVSVTEAVRQGVFHAVSASNNAGFSLYPDNLTRFVGDPVIMLTVCVAIVVGGVGTPVLLELFRTWRSPRRWSVHTRLTLWATAILLVVGLGVMVVYEWRNPATLGGLPPSERVLGAVFHAVQPRTSGFNVIEMSQVRQESLFLTVALMFIGGGSAGTAGGIKVTTAAILVFILWAEIRGDEDVTVNRRRIASQTQRQAVGVTSVAALAVGIGTLVIMTTSEIGLGQALFEATSAFGTVGLSLGFDADLPASAKLVLIALMFIGRVGPVAAFSFFALRATQVRYRYPESRPMVG